MTSILLQRAVDGQGRPWARDVNVLLEVAAGMKGGGILLAGHDGTRRDNALTTNYALDVSSQAVGGLHAVFPLKATASGVAKTPANSVLLVQDAGLSIGVGKYLRLYDAAGVDHADLTSDADGGLVLTGVGANAGLFSGLTILALGATPATTGALRLTNNTGAYWRNAANGANLLGLGYDAADNLLIGDATNGLSATVQAKAAGTVYLRVGVTDRLELNATNAIARANLIAGTDNTYDIGAAAATRFRSLYLAGAATINGHLTWTTDATYDIGASGATRPRNLFLSGDITLGGGAWVDFSSSVTLSQNGARTRTVTYAKYRLIGKTATVRGQITCTNLGTAGNVVTIGALPAAITAAQTGAVAISGTISWYDSSTGTLYVGAAALATGTTIIGHTNAAAGLTGMGALGPNLAIDNGDTVSFFVEYETT